MIRRLLRYLLSVDHEVALVVINERAQVAQMALDMGAPEVAKAVRARGMTAPLAVHPLPQIHVKH